MERKYSLCLMPKLFYFRLDTLKREDTIIHRNKMLLLSRLILDSSDFLMIDIFGPGDINWLHA